MVRHLRVRIVWMRYVYPLPNSTNSSIETSAPTCIDKNMPGTVVDEGQEVHIAYPPSRMEVVSPTSVAAPCRLEEPACR